MRGPSSAAGASPHCWSGTTRFRALARSIARRSRPPNFCQMQTCVPPPESSLAAVQCAMARAVMHPLGAREEMQHNNRDVVAAIIKPNDRLTSFERLQIYNQLYWWRLLG